MEIKKKVIVRRAGGNAGNNSLVYRLNLPAQFARELGITETDREVKLTLEFDRMIIVKERI